MSNNQNGLLNWYWVCNLTGKKIGDGRINSLTDPRNVCPNVIIDKGYTKKICMFCIYHTSSDALELVKKEESIPKKPFNRFAEIDLI